LPVVTAELSEAEKKVIKKCFHVSIAWGIDANELKSTSDKCDAEDNWMKCMLREAGQEEEFEDCVKAGLSKLPRHELTEEEKDVGKKCLRESIAAHVDSAEELKSTNDKCEAEDNWVKCMLQETGAADDFRECFHKGLEELQGKFGLEPLLNAGGGHSTACLLGSFSAAGVLGAFAGFAFARRYSRRSAWELAAEAAPLSGVPAA